MATLIACMSLVAARIAARLGPRVPITAGQVLMAAGLVIFCAAPATTPTWLLAMLMVPIGTGGALAVPALTALLLDYVPAECAGTASGVLNTCRQLGGALAVAVFGALVAHRETFMHGLRASLLITALLLLATTAASLLLKPAPQR
jgi:DHA2 family methylenomycin A resistance protein-like MFS transporter